MKMRYLGLLSLVGIVFLAGCATQVDVSSIAKQLPAVQEFLNQHPNAEIKALLLSAETVQQNIEEITKACGGPLPIKSYWKVVVTENNNLIIVYLEPKEISPVCISRTKLTEGGEVTSPLPVEPTHITTEGIEVIDAYCLGGNKARIVVRNIGTLPINTNDMLVTRTEGKGILSLSWDASSISTGTSTTLSDFGCATTSPTTCIYRLVLPTGKTTIATVSCSGGLSTAENQTAQTVTNVTVLCTDSDGGINASIKGHGTGQYAGKSGDNYYLIYGQEPNPTTPRDTSGPYDTYIDHCVGGLYPNQLNEAYCQENGKLGAIGIECPYGCKDGACIQPTVVIAKQLSTYPTFLYTNNVLDAVVVHGSVYSTEEKITAADIANSLGLKVKFDTEITSIDKSKNLILIGTPCTNSLINDLSTVEKFRYKCTTWPAENFGVLEIIDNAYTSGKVALIVGGTRGEDIKLAGDVLRNYATKLAGFDSKAVKITGTSIADALISVSLPKSQGCARANPTVVITPSSQNVSAGKSIDYTVKITNNDNLACDSSVFNRWGIFDGTGIDYVTDKYAGTSLPAIAPSETLSFNMTALSKSTALAGDYKVGMHIENTNAPSYWGESTAILNIAGNITSIFAHCIPTSINNNTGEITCDSWTDVKSSLASVDGKTVTLSDAAPSTVIKVFNNDYQYFYANNSADVCLKVLTDLDNNAVYETLVKDACFSPSIIQFYTVPLNASLLYVSTKGVIYVDYIGQKAP